MATASNERRVGLPALLFFGLLILLSATVTGVNLWFPVFRLYGPVAITISMWIPGVAGIVAGRYSRITLVGSQFPRIRFLALAFIGPVAVCGIVRGALWLSGLSIMVTDLKQMGLASYVQLFLSLLLCFAGALGEELGWRGFLGPLLARRFDFAALVWCSWLPWFLFYLWLFFAAGSYSNPAFGLQLCTIGSLLFGLNVLLVWLRLKSGSLLPPLIFHAVHNLFAFDPLTLGFTKTPWLTGELGLGLACGYLAISFGVFWDSGGSSPKARYRMTNSQ
jgi:membrane protease YdiL (CAAX protease family)